MITTTVQKNINYPDTEHFSKRVGKILYEVWYSEFHKCWLLVRNDLTILNAGEKQQMLNKLKLW